MQQLHEQQYVRRERRILRMVAMPLARLCLKLGIPFGEISEVLRGAFVEAARKDGKIFGKEPTQSRISLLTGLTRKDVHRIIESDPDLLARPGDSSVPARILGEWATSRKWANAKGDPADLPIAHSSHRSFTALCRKHTTNCTARTVLDELVQLENVEVVGDRVRLISPVYIQSRDHLRLLEIGLHSAQRLMETILHNIKHSDEPELGRLERLYTSRYVPREKLPAIRKKVREMLKLSHDGMAAAVDDVEQVGPLEQDSVGFGLFYFEEPEEEKL